MLVHVLSDKFVTKENPTGQGVIDLDTPEGVEIFGGQKEADDYRYEQLIQKQVEDTKRTDAIKKLKTDGLLPKFYEQKEK